MQFSNQTLVVTGSSSGIGAATVSLALSTGAEVHAVDIVAPSTTREPGRHDHQCDLADPDSIARLTASLPEIDAVLNCAGIPNGGRFDPVSIMKVNWLGLRLLTESLIHRLGPEGSIVHVGSTAGRDWALNAQWHNELMAATSFDDGLKWVEDHLDLIGDGYGFSKQAVQYYTVWRSVQLLRLQIRMNCVNPGVTDTNLVSDFRAGVGNDVIDHAVAVAGRMATPQEMAPAILFLADRASSAYITGVNLNVDRGTGAARATNQSDPATIWANHGHR